jgi:hypothetical protein
VLSKPYWGMLHLTLVTTLGAWDRHAMIFCERFYFGP